MYLNDDPLSTPASYLKKLYQLYDALDPTFLIDWQQSYPTDYAQNVGEAFLVSWEQLDNLAKRFFQVGGYCAANTPIPVAVFHELTKLSWHWIDDFSSAKALEHLQTLGLAVPPKAACCSPAAGRVRPPAGPSQCRKRSA